MRQSRTIISLSAVLLLGACGTLMEGQGQEIRLVTPGATEAECALDNGVRYVVTTGETVTIMRTSKDLVAECYASGNRYKKVVFERMLNGWAAGNVVTGVLPGLAYDHISGGLYGYPDTLSIDFTHVGPHGFDLPEYHNKDAPSPYSQPMELYGAREPATGKDNGASLPYELKKRDPASMSNNPFADINPAPAPVIGVNAAPVSNAPSIPTGSNAEELTRSANPSVFKK